MELKVQKTATETKQLWEQQSNKDSQTSLPRYDCFNRNAYSVIVASTFIINIVTQRTENG
jgi:hypothetical protein